jgi:hypothetical protein
MLTLPSDVERFVETEGRSFMVTRRRDGSPTCHPMGNFYAEGRFYLNMYVKSIKQRNLQRDPRVTCLVATASDQAQFKAVIYRGVGRQLAPEESLAADSPPGVRKALRMDVGQDGGHPQQDEADETEHLLKRTTAMRSRIRDGLRVLWEVEPEDCAWLHDVRGA